MTPLLSTFSAWWGTAALAGIGAVGIVALWPRSKP